MKLWKKALLIGVLVAPTAAIAQAPGTGLTGTAHDFATNAAYAATALVNGTTTTAIGQCTLCHTPHSALQQPLLWNHRGGIAAYSYNEALTAGGTPYPSIAPAYKGPSVKCLSCHDASVAIGEINMFANVKPASVNTFVVGGPPGLETTHIIGALGNMSGNHPVAMPYPFNNVASTYNGSTNGAEAMGSGWVANPHAPVTGIKLFNDNGGGQITAGTAAGRTGIECSSCHDPHNKQTQDDFLLRGKLVSTTGGNDGYICTKCHVK